MSNYIIASDGSFRSVDELYHHGIKGMKWGVRRYQNEDGTLTEAGKKRSAKTIEKIGKMYDHSNKWTRRKVDKLNAKGKTAKANVMEEMIRRNEKAKQEKIDAVSKMNADDLTQYKRKDLTKSLYAQNFMSRNALSMTTPLSRLNEYNMQRAMRWASNYTFESTLSEMSVKEGYEYLDRKAREQTASNRGLINIRSKG